MAITSAVERWKAFRAFLARHPTAVRVTSWLSFIWAAVALAFEIFSDVSWWTAFWLLVAWATPMLTLANLAIFLTFVVACLSGGFLFVGYYEQRTKSGELAIQLRDVRDASKAELEVLQTKLALAEAKLGVTELERDDARKESALLLDKARWHVGQMSEMKDQLHEANRAWSAIAFQQLVMFAEGQQWKPTVRLRWIEAEDTELADQMEAIFKELAPSWPVTKDRDPGSVLRQSGHRRICFESKNRHLVSTISHCFSRAKWAGEFTDWDDEKATDTNIVMTIFPKQTARKDDS